MATNKQIHSLVLDTGPIIKNDPAVSTLIQKAETLWTVPAIISEIKDATTRSRVASTLQPFLTVRSPNPKSVKLISDFARRTGDLAVLSRPDLEIIALTYELECERNGGDWRLRRTPGQKRLNGAPPSKDQPSTEESNAQSQVEGAVTSSLQTETSKPSEESMNGALDAQTTTTETKQDENSDGSSLNINPVSDDAEQDQDNSTPLAADADETPSDNIADAADLAEDLAESDTDSDGWITPSNLKKHQSKDAAISTVNTPESTTMQAAVLTSDFAMQNVILQMNLNLLSSSMQRIKHMKTFVLRCHACFQVTKEMSKQFCPRCGQSTLTRVACSTDSSGEFRLHLKKNMQWNHRGDRYSVPKPVHGAANRRVRGGGKGGWGNELMLAEDQKEYDRARTVEKRQKERNLMDEDYLPSILTGDRGKTGGRIKVGAGRNVNSRKR